MSQSLGGPEGWESATVELREVADTPSEAPPGLPGPGGVFVVQLEYDDGNGVWFRNF